MKFVVMSLIVFLTACSTTVPVQRRFPEPLPELMKKCENLLQIEGEKVSIVDMLKVVVQNYSLYYQCSAKVDGWQDWYTEQKKIFNEVK